MDKGESLKDTVQTLSAYDPAAIVIRSPHAGAAGLVARWSTASVVNAGDGKHEHPTQALLDVYTLRRRRGELDGLEHLDRRRRAAQPRGALQHPGLHAHGLQGHRLRPAHADPARGRVARLPRCATTLDDLGEADVVYALRMQNERMDGSFVPSLREYAARYQIDGRRLGRGQLLMHPGPVNRGVELAAEVIDSPQALIVEQVESGVVVRMAVLYELLAGGGGAGAEERRPGSRSARPRSPSRHERRGTAPPGARPRRSAPGTVLMRGARLLDPRAGLDGEGDVLVRGGHIAEVGEPGSLDAPRAPRWWTPRA